MDASIASPSDRRPAHRTGAEAIREQALRLYGFAARARMSHTDGASFYGLPLPPCAPTAVPVVKLASSDANITYNGANSAG